MNILVVCQYYYPEPFRITDICEELVRRGHSITVLTGLPNYPDGVVKKEYKKKEHLDEVVNGVRVIRCHEHGRGKNSISLLINYWSYPFFGSIKVNRIKIKEEFDLVFINQLSPVMMAFPGLKYAKRYNKKVLLYCYDLWPASLVAGGVRRDSVIYRLFKKISTKIYKKANYICVTSKLFTQYFIEEHLIDKAKLEYLPQYCEDLFSSVLDVEKHKNDYFDFTFAGNIGKMQSVETIIRAANLVKENRQIRINIFGDGRDLDECKQLVKDLHADNVLFHGRKSVEEMPKYYSISDAMIVTLAFDELVAKTLPGKVQSYMAAGKPIIGAIDGEAARIIREAQGDYCCESENYEELAKLMRKMANNSRSELKRLGTNNRIYYQHHFSKEAFFERLEKVMTSMIED